jgi:hypothetical protein
MKRSRLTTGKETYRVSNGQSELRTHMRLNLATAPKRLKLRARYKTDQIFAARLPFHSQSPDLPDVQHNPGDAMAGFFACYLTLT